MGNDGTHKPAGDNSKKFLITFINKLVNLFMLIIFFEPVTLLQMLKVASIFFYQKRTADSCGCYVSTGS